ncbi:fungal-specific transcription factor domain-containing protein [Lasiosphaeria miniovina]|uniref:Fungal-specific transcription factor domain-containing protein n=1 Tax=Lasiosphaeria miniovina TaxID=1954250 RepID=A0AA40AJ96_9PEZI|nr:fungal-specific transcription factor domain-containing protein [Lasiosphaeria miniovina]KAK0716785.1 fungal-specific transcription factor domain-containing protein [Lasiosphaeria miniovina]
MYMYREGGCWTCRLRRKKCDRHGPVCRVCSALLITCHYTPEKPDWVDGGERQREMAEQLRQEVRDKAPYRRSLAYTKAIVHDECMPYATVPPGLPEAGAKASDAANPPTRPRRDALETFSGKSPGSGNGNTHPASARFPGVSSIAPSTSSPDRDVQRAPDWTGLDRGLIVCYLEFYFPFLFPFYQPSMLDRGRAWVVDFITDSQAMEQTTLSLSSYFFSLALETAQEAAHETCKQIAWEKLLNQIHGTFGLLRQELPCVTAADGVAENLPRAVQIMGCILLLQRFETAVCSFENCEAHLSAATELFRHALDGTGAAALDGTGTAAASGPTARPCSFALTMRQLRGHGPPWPRQYPTFQAPSSEQMAFRFFSALLLVDDIVASTALGEEPKLHQYHASILGDGQWPADRDGEDEAYTIRLEGIVGCQNWAMVAVAKVSALDAWKKRRRAAGDLDVMELVLRAAAIKGTLVANLTRAEVAPPLAVPFSAGTGSSSSGSGSSGRSSAWDIFTPCNGQASALAEQSLLVTRIWAHAAALYLSVVVSGWQPASAEVRHHVACVLELLTQRALSWAALRTVAWPFCVAGCLAAHTQEPLMRSVVEGLRPPGLLGPVQKALQIMEAVWRSRDLLDSTTWDLAACFRGPGHLVLLV